MNVRFLKTTNINDLKNIYDCGLVSHRFWTTQEVDTTALYIIVVENKPIGLMQAYLDTFHNGRKYLYLSMIELFPKYRGKGVYGKLVVGYLFQIFGVSSMKGESLPSAIPFWYKIGANFESSKKKLLEYINQGYSSNFTLSRDKFFKVLYNK
jgi:hypothetical protein